MAQDRLSHAYMLIGPEGDSRDAAATELAAAMVCVGQNKPCRVCRHCRKAFAHIHPDIITVGREDGKDGKTRQNIVVEQVRQITADAVIAPNEADRKVYIFAQADRMNTAAQNALLKSLEEPAGHSCYILCTASAEALLQTVRSRCIQKNLGSAAQAVQKTPDHVMRYLMLAMQHDRAQLLLHCMQQSGLDREETEAFLEQAESAAADILCGRQHVRDADTAMLLHITELTGQMKDWLRHNVSPKQIFTVLAIKTMR